jgi:hypothetical protein
MVRQLKRKGSLAALAAIAIAVGGLLWHLLACVDTQMAFSPDGQEIAFTVIDELDGSPMAQWRLFVLRGDDRLELIDSFPNGILSGPAYSPDGSQFAYLRIPNLAHVELEEGIEEEFDRRWELLEELTDADTLWIPPIADEKTPEEPYDMSRPSALLEAEHYLNLMVPAVLVVRDRSTATEIHRITVGLPFLWEDTDNDLGLFLQTVTPRYGADSELIYLLGGGIGYIQAVSVSTGDVDIVSRRLGATYPVVLSPDGTTLAGFSGSVDEVPELVISGARGDKALYIWPAFEVSLAAVTTITWKDSKTLILLSEDDELRAGLRTIRATDGVETGFRPLDIECDVDAPNQLAVASTGAFMVLATMEEGVFFLDHNGDLLGDYVDPEGRVLTSPTISPDATRVALKCAEDAYRQTLSILIMTPTGEIIREVPIPEPIGNDE